MCKRCQSKGYIESWHAGSASWTPSIQQCPERCNISGYSAEVQRRLNNPHYVTESPVLQAKQPEKILRPVLRLVEPHAHQES